MSGSSVAVVGAGISGITAAHVLQQCGFAVTVYERAPSVGGVWATAYPGVRLQNVRSQYHISDFPWPEPPDLHPTGAQIRRYLEAAVDRLGLDVRPLHDVAALEEVPNGWRLSCETPRGPRRETFDHVVIASGQYAESKPHAPLPGASVFDGAVVTERDVPTLDLFDGRRVVVVGFGKSAVDMATLAAGRALSVAQLFREPRWLIPPRLLGLHFTVPLFSRLGSVMMPSWAHPTRLERMLHTRLRGAVDAFWRQIEGLFRDYVTRHAVHHAPDDARRRLAAVTPGHPLVYDLRSACALAPERYFALVADGTIVPQRGEAARLTRDALVCADGTTLPCDLVVMCVGSASPRFPYLPAHYRALLEGDDDGPQLYRHLVHPAIPRLGFAGFNHSFLHVPGVEVGTLWLAEYFRGRLRLPDAAADAMRSMRRVRDWKRAHIRFEPSRGCAVSTRYQQYLDLLLMDLGLSPYRKLPNVAAELLARYGAADYRGVRAELSARRSEVRRPVAVDT